MIHEFKRLLEAHTDWVRQGLRSVMVTVVDLEGSSYRRPGVRMILNEKGEREGAVSGGCVEKEVFRQSDEVFSSGIPKIMRYDGRYRLGCDGIITLLIEPFDPDTSFYEQFDAVLGRRIPMEIQVFYHPDEGRRGGMGSMWRADHSSWRSMRAGVEPERTLPVFSQSLSPRFRLLIIGAEHDAVSMCRMAALLGHEVIVVAPAQDPRALIDFPGVSEVLNLEAGTDLSPWIDAQTGVVVMTHSYSTDLKYLLALQQQTPAYLGLLGAQKRREKLFEELMQQKELTDPEWLESIHGPAGLDIGAETPEEIALSVLSEMMAVVRNHDARKLMQKVAPVHATLEERF